MTATETMTTLRADELQPGDVVRLVTDMDMFTRYEVHGDQRLRLFVQPAAMMEMGVWLWKYSRVEVLSDVNGRGHLVTPVHRATQESESMEEKIDAAV